MKNIKWLLDLASRKPLIFSLALLLIAVSTLAVVVADRDKKLTKCIEYYNRSQSYYSERIDSIVLFYKKEQERLNKEVKETLTYIIMDYKLQLEQQKELNNKVNNTIISNKNLIKNNNLKLHYEK